MRLSNKVSANSLNVQAARDSGDQRGDRERRANVMALVQRANGLLEASAGGKYPEAEEAARAVQGVSDLLATMDRLSGQLKAAPAASAEASAAQNALNGVRLSLDAMLVPLEASLISMETLLLATLEIEEQFEALRVKTTNIEANLKEAKARVAAIAAAVKSTAKIG